jgi:hypothetical protein
MLHFAEKFILTSWSLIKCFIADGPKNDNEKVLTMNDSKDERVEDFLEKIGKIKNQSNIIAETINIKRDNIQKEADTISKLERYNRKHKYILSMYKNVPIEKLKGMNDNEYSAFITVANSSGVSGEASFCLHEESKKTNYLYQQHYSTVASLDILAGADSTSVQVISLTNPEWFPDSERITREHEIEDEIDNQIEYIAGQLQTQFSDLKDDFNSFIMKFQTFRGDRSQYQDLIGSRSMFFFKMIFEFSKQSYNVESPRIEAIKKFVFGSSPFVASTEPLLRACNNLYREMSSQDSTGMSVKLGVTSSSYIESLFSV